MDPPPTYPALRTDIAGIDALDLARQFGTPLYVYDAAMIVRRLKDLAAFDVVRFAQKACSNLAVVDLVRRHGGLVDSVSAGEIHRALAAGFLPTGDPPPVVYTADIFDADALDLVLDKGIHVNCGSPEMIDQYAARASGGEITLRINPGFGHGHSQKTNTGGDSSKHGIWHEELPDCMARARRQGLTVTGLHVHIGSGTDLEHLAQVCTAMERLALTAGPTITSVSAGGGLPTPYHSGEAYVDVDAYHRLWSGVRGRLAEAFGHPMRLEIEPGRYLAAESGYLLAEVRAVKQQGENTFVLLDAGFNNLARPILYGAYHPMSLIPADGATDRPTVEMVVGGPLCESGDIFTQEEGGFVSKRSLPQAKVGDLMAIECAGAYGFAMASNYNSRPFPAEVLLQDGHPHLIRRRQTYEELLSFDTIP